jgi:integrase/recombinase XerD
MARNKGGQVTVVGKGNKERTVKIAPDFWCELMELQATATGKTVFVSRKGDNHPLSTTQVWMIVHQAAERAGIDKPVSPHWYRHAHASHSLDRGANINLVKETLGHASLVTTSRYTHAKPSESSSDYLAI